VSRQIKFYTYSYAVGVKVFKMLYFSSTGNSVQWRSQEFATGGA